MTSRSACCIGRGNAPPAPSSRTAPTERCVRRAGVQCDEASLGLAPCQFDGRRAHQLVQAALDAAVGMPASKSVVADRAHRADNVANTDFPSRGSGAARVSSTIRTDGVEGEAWARCAASRSQAFLGREPTNHAGTGGIQHKAQLASGGDLCDGRGDAGFVGQVECNGPSRRVPSNIGELAALREQGFKRAADAAAGADHQGHAARRKRCKQRRASAMADQSRSGAPSGK